MKLPRNLNGSDLHKPIKPKTLSSILKSIAAHHGVSVEELLKQLDL